MAPGPRCVVCGGWHCERALRCLDHSSRPHLSHPAKPTPTQLAASKKDPKICLENQCCCGQESTIIHFKGRLKQKMFSYWEEACEDGAVYGCPVIQARCDSASTGGSV